MISGIYKIQSLSNPKKFYIGSAINLKNRKSQHFSLLKKRCHYNKIMQNAYDKYNDLVFINIEIVFNVQLLIIREQYYINSLNPPFNICKKAGSPLGVKHSDSTKYNRSLALIGNKNSLGFKHSKETKIKLSNIRIGNKNGKGNKGKSLTESQKLLLSIKHSKIILNTQTGIFYESAKELSKLHGYKLTTLRAKLNGQNLNNTNYIYV